MDEAIQPIGGRPVLVGKGAPFTRIVVSQVQPADEEPYHVMFIGTGKWELLYPLKKMLGGILRVVFFKSGYLNAIFIIRAASAELFSWLQGP